MTTTGLIKILKDNEYGGISHKPREISLTINGKYMPDPQIVLSSTGDGIAGPEIDLDIDGEFFEEQEPILDKIRTEIAKKESRLGFADISDAALKVAYIEVLKIIDKYRGSEG